MLLTEPNAPTGIVAALWTVKARCAVRITHAKLGQEAGTRGNRLVTICAELARPNEFLNLTVAVPNNGTDLDVCHRGIERAKDFAKEFVNLSLLQFPCPSGKAR